MSVRTRITKLGSKTYSWFVKPILREPENKLLVLKDIDNKEAPIVIPIKEKNVSPKLVKEKLRKFKNNNVKLTPGG